MKNLITLTILSLLTYGSVLAKSGGEPNNTQCNGVGNANSPCNPSSGGGTTPGVGGGSITNNFSPNLQNIGNNEIFNNSSATAISGSNSNSAVTNTSTNTNQALGFGGSSANTNNSNSNTSINSVLNVPQQAPPAIAPNVAAPGNNGFSGGFSTPFGGISLGSSTVDASVRQFNRASADALLMHAMMEIQTCSSEECLAAKKYLLKRFSK